MTPEQLDQLYEQLCRLVINCTKVALLVKSLEMRVESLEKKDSAKRSLVS